LVASFALLGSTPRSLSQPSTVFFASESWALRSPLWLVIPTTITNTTPAPSAMIETSSSSRAQAATNAVTPEPTDQRRGNRGHHSRGDHRHHDGVRERHDPDPAHQEEGHADEQPSRETHVTKPSRSVEYSGQLAGIDLDDLVLRLRCFAVLGTAVQARAEHGATIPAFRGRRFARRG
jgi:hypothetical protein